MSPDGKRKKISIYDMVVRDIVYLSTGDQVPVDGIYLSGYCLLINEFGLSGESEPINVNEEKPFLLSRTKVHDGLGKMLVTTLGMKTKWGKLRETQSEGGEDETPLHVKLNGVTTLSGKIGLAFAVVTFLVLAIRFLVEKWLHGEILSWSSNDTLKLMDFLVIDVTIIVVGVHKGLPLAVTLSLAFAIKKLMNDKALVRHVSACEIMGSSSCICTNKTGKLISNLMVVNKLWRCEEVTSIEDSNNYVIAIKCIHVDDLEDKFIFNGGGNVTKLKGQFGKKRCTAKCHMC